MDTARKLYHCNNNFKSIAKCFYCGVCVCMGDRVCSVQSMPANLLLHHTSKRNETESELLLLWLCGAAQAQAAE